ncbi:peptidase family M50 family protein [Asticcacaulis biprosthecium C19]|uniref:Peptidase family M50 family protein n=1 Tax=Asticcacaulis biprosthecium C19 TaxID=715226 RepID=F4QU30_9CAUL|nr:site-2 protease family protein [Asticcacaulis biprosthecium]EGF89330.1 peptidase family M50 family protein [Asticcacaulis biprosthecium C19]
MKNNISWLFIGLLAAFAATGFLLALAPDLALLTFVFVLLGWLISLCLHEYAHALVASKFGDYTVAGSGYLTLDPRHYFYGPTSLILPIIALVMGGIGLPGGAVMIRTDLIRKRWHQSAISLAGPAATLICAVLVYFGAVALQGLPALFVSLMVLFFFLLTAFILNMLPIPGLDGFGAISPYLPQRWRNAVSPQVSGLMIVALLVLVFFFGYRIIMPIMLAITGALGIDLAPVFLGLGRFRLW